MCMRSGSNGRTCGSSASTCDKSSISVANGWDCRCSCWPSGPLNHSNSQTAFASCGSRQTTKAFRLGFGVQQLVGVTVQSVQQSRSPAGLGEQPDHQPLASGQQVLQRLAHMVEGIGRG